MGMKKVEPELDKEARIKKHASKKIKNKKNYDDDREESVGKKYKRKKDVNVIDYLDDLINNNSKDW